MPLRLAIAQIAMRWTTAENMASIREAMNLAQSRSASLCCFSELAVTGFHRQIVREATPQLVLPAIRELQRRSGELSLGIAVGAPTFADDGAIFNSHVLIDERGEVAAVVPKRGLTDPEATFFARGTSRPIGTIQGMRCSAVICREVEDWATLADELPPGSVDLILVPGALRPDPEKPRTNPPQYVLDIQRLASITRAHVVQTNWPNALNRPEESIDGGSSFVASPDGDVLFRLPARASGVGVFDLGHRHYDWYPSEA